MTILYTKFGESRPRCSSYLLDTLFTLKVTVALIFDLNIYMGQLQVITNVLTNFGECRPESSQVIVWKPIYPLFFERGYNIVWRHTLIVLNWWEEIRHDNFDLLTFEMQGSSRAIILWNLNGPSEIVLIIQRKLISMF